MNSKPWKMVGASLATLLLTSLLQAEETPILRRHAVDAGLAAIQPHAIRAHMAFLADDLLEGRGTATRGYDVSARYVATQFASMGLKPAGTGNSFLQAVPLRAVLADENQSHLHLLPAGQRGTAEELKYRDDYLLRGDFSRATTSVQAPIVFAGFGITAPSEHYDDYAHIDAKGKIVALIFGAPPFESALKAHYTSTLQKVKNAVAHGAVGLILINDPVLESLYPFAKRVRDLRTPGYRWLDGAGMAHDYFPQIKVNAQLSMAASRRLFERAPQSIDKVYEAAKAGRPPAFDLAFTAKAETVTQSQDLSSSNVAAMLPGSDPTLAGEYVVYSAHLDHLGFTPVKDGDGIYNGALDNASGTAIMLETARALSQMKPRRSILFVAVTAEEAGLLGSDYFANNPTVPKNALVANVNIDEDKMLWPVRDIVAYGADHSSLGAVARNAADRLQLTISPDPSPKSVTFVRSDQYSFVQQGVPALMPTPGYESVDPAIDPRALSEHWEETRYHEVGDDMNQPGLDFESAATFARYAFLCGYLIAEETPRPEWNPRDFFGTLYGRKTK